MTGASNLSEIKIQCINSKPLSPPLSNPHEQNAKLSTQNSSLTARGRGCRTIIAFIGQYDAGVTGVTSLIGAVAQAIVEVDVLAKTRSISGTTTPEDIVLGQHVVEAGLAAGREIGNGRWSRGRRRRHRSRGGDWVSGLSRNGRRTVTAFKSKHSAGNIRSTGRIRAVADTIVEVDISTEAGWV